MVLPLDILLLVIEYYSDQTTLYMMGLTCRCVSPHALKQLWCMPYISNSKSFHRFIATLASTKALHPYQDWVTGLALHLQSEDEATYNNQIISDPLVFSTLLSIKLEIVSLQEIRITRECALPFTQFLTKQLNGGMSELHVYECTTITVDCILTSLEVQERPYLRSLHFHDCFLTDYQIERLAMRKVCSYLHTLVLNRCGCLSDTATLAIALHCRQLVTLVITLPSSLVQSNMITLKTIEALEIHCLSLKQFVCGGQIRISEYVKSSTSNIRRQHFHITDSWPLL